MADPDEVLVRLSELPEWSTLIDWAQGWWYEHGSDSDVGRAAEMRRFVVDVSAQLLELYDDLPNSQPDTGQPTY